MHGRHSGIYGFTFVPVNICICRWITYNRQQILIIMSYKLQPSLSVVMRYKVLIKTCGESDHLTLTFK